MKEGGAMGSQRRRGLASWEVAAVAAAGTAGAVALFIRLCTGGVGGPARARAGREGRYIWEHGDIWYTVKGQGAPLVLIHGIYAGASSYEYRRVFDLLARDRRVYAFDLLGFGRSARPPLVYPPGLYEQLITDFVREVVRGGGHR